MANVKMYYATYPFTSDADLTEASVSTTQDYLVDGMAPDEVRAMGCNDDGNTCFAVGMKYTDSSCGGFVLYTYDAGASWFELEHEDIKGTSKNTADGEVYTCNQDKFYAVDFVGDKFWIVGSSNIISGELQR